MANTVLITTDNKIKVMDIPWDIKIWEEAINANCTEIVRTRFMYDFFGDKIVMIVDESGKVKHRDISLVGAFLYGIQLHGDCICGDILLAKQEGLDTVPLEDPTYIKSLIKRRFPNLEDEADA